MIYHYQGIIPALPTPFYNGELDLESWQKLCLRLSDCHALVVGGSTGEGATLSDAELGQLIAKTREILPKKPIIAGIGLNCTQATIKRARVAQDADALLVVTPYYNKPPQEGLYQHFKQVAAATSQPIILYNVPGRTGCNLLPATVERLMDIPNIVSIKESSGDLSQLQALMHFSGMNKSGKKFTVLSGEDHLILPTLALGGHGAISVVANVLPQICLELYQACCQEKYQQAAVLQLRLKDIIDYLFCESNPIPLKAMLKEMGIFRSAQLRLPLVELSADKLPRLMQVMRQL